MMSRFKLMGSVLGMVMAFSLVGCAGKDTSPAAAPHSAAEGPSAPYEPATEAAYESDGYPQENPPEEPEAPASQGAYSQPQKSSTPAAESMAGDDSGRARRMEAPPADRPGLGTAWGETRRSLTSSAPFVRDTAAPFAVASLWYNDRTGAEAMSRWADYRTHARGAVPVLGGALTVSLRDDSGRMLNGFFAGGKDYVIGDAGSRYVIVVQNNTAYRYECVASVDGLDVIDGRQAAYTKRGYLIQPHGVLEIEGFRRSADAVAAFRFSSVRGSYAAKSGKGDRNVGVIGIAFFNEEGSRPTWSPDELRRRHSADPFPGRYAEPPQ